MQVHLISEVRTKIRPKDYQAEIKKLEAIDDNGLYPKILELPKGKKTRGRAMFDPHTEKFTDDMETFQ